MCIPSRISLLYILHSSTFYLFDPENMYDRWPKEKIHQIANSIRSREVVITAIMITSVWLQMGRGRNAWFKLSLTVLRGYNSSTLQTVWPFRFLRTTPCKY